MALHVLPVFQEVVCSSTIYSRSIIQIPCQSFKKKQKTNAFLLREYYFSFQIEVFL